MTTWEVGQKLVRLENSKADSSLLNYISRIFLSIYVFYKEVEEYAEFIVRLPQIIAGNRYDEDIQAITEPLLKYWNEVIVPKMNEYLSIYDRSEFCAPLPKLLPDFVVHKGKHKAMIIYQKDDFGDYLKDLVGKEEDQIFDNDYSSQTFSEFEQLTHCLEHSIC